MASPEILKLGMWQDWQDRVKASLPNFAANPIYVEQGRPVEEFEEIAKYVFERHLFDSDGRVRDAEFGARVVQTSRGPMTRMWLDSCVEMDFLSRALFYEGDVNDIG